MPERITNLPPEELEAAFLLLPRVLCDWRHPHEGFYTLAYLYANTPDAEDSMFERAVELAHAGMINILATSEGALGFGYAGFEHSLARLTDMGLPSETAVEGFLVDENPQGVRNVNTGSESKKLAEHVKDYGPNDHVAVLAPPHHITRAFVTTITALRNVGADRKVRVFAVPGIPLPWGKTIAHSQGKTDILANWLVAELKRLEHYRGDEFGNMITFAEAIEYLNWRDGINAG
jgi:hypothetical protein